MNTLRRERRSQAQQACSTREHRQAYTLSKQCKPIKGLSTTETASLCHAVGRDIRKLAHIELDTITSHSKATFYNQLLKPGDSVVLRVPQEDRLPNSQVRSSVSWWCVVVS